MPRHWLLPVTLLLALPITACSSSDAATESPAGGDGAGGMGGDGAGGASGKGGIAGGAGSFQAGAGGKAGASGGGAVGGAGQGGTSAGSTGASGQAGVGGSPLCVPGSQVACACPGSSVPGAQVCQPDGLGLGPCEGCPAGTGGAGASGGGGGGAAAGMGGDGGSGQSGAAGAAAGAAGSGSVLPEDNDQACGDGLDNDGDGDVDCEDLGCSQNQNVTVCAAQAGGSGGQGGSAGQGSSGAAGASEGGAAGNGGSGAAAGNGAAGANCTSAPGGSGGAAGTDVGGGGGVSGQGSLGPCYPTAPACIGLDGSRCIALANNASLGVKTLRISQLHITAPAALATGAFPVAFIMPSVTLNLPACYLESSAKGGLLNWLLSLDTEKSTLTIGGALVPLAPEQGYHFMKQTVGTVGVTPATVAIDYDTTTGAFSAKQSIPKLALPIYNFNPHTPQGAGKDPTLLPLSNVIISDGILSEGGNCIGRFKGEQGELDKFCLTTSSKPPEDAAYSWVNGAKLTGTITLEEADKVDILEFGQSLCTLITKHKTSEPDPTGIKRCGREGSGHIDLAGTSDIEGAFNAEYVTFTTGITASAVTLTDCP
jgi:hypothetical protein